MASSYSYSYSILSKTETIVTQEDKKLILPRLYAHTNWQKNTISTSSLKQIVDLPYLVTIVTTNLLVIDFDTDDSFKQALALNASLAPQSQCKLIVASSRKGGHFYYRSSPDDEALIPPLHTKQAVLDVLTGPKHNVIAPTTADKGKTIVVRDYELTPYPLAMASLVSLIVLQNLPEKAYHYSYLPQERHSDDALEFIRSYLADIVKPHQFNQFYGLPDIIPPQQSNSVYLSLSTRLGSDRTIDTETYLKVMTKYNSTHQRKTPEELRSQITDRMVTGQAQLDGVSIWQYDPEASTAHTYTTLHRQYSTQVKVYFDIIDNSYLIEYKDKHSQTIVLTKPNLTAYTEVAEKITISSKDSLRRNSSKITSIVAISDYSKPHGYSPDDNTYNRVVHNSFLNAFEGTKPEDYSYPEKLLQLLEYMWGKEESNYLLATTKYRYLTFAFSPVVTNFVGTEGSGKDLSIAILTKGFNTPPQSLNYSLLKDKHSNWQIEPNAVFSEIGSWQPYEKTDLMAELKTVSGSNGKVTFRDMQTVSRVVDTQIKIWITGNEWVKLHTDPNAQRRIHVVYMPKPLEQAQGGPYSTREIEWLMSDTSLLNFYYWLGNECQLSVSPSDYRSAVCRQNSESYLTYKENVESLSDLAAPLLYGATYTGLTKALRLFNLSIDDIAFRYTKEHKLAIAIPQLKDALALRGGNLVIDKTLDRLASDRFGNKRLAFDDDGNKVKYFIAAGAPLNLDLNLIKD